MSHDVGGFLCFNSGNVLLKITLIEVTTISVMVKNWAVFIL